MSSSRGDKRVRMDHDERRGLILHAASELFLDRPYSEVSITDIAEAAGVARGLLHHYFESKRDLYLEVVRRASKPPRVLVPDDSDAGTRADAWTHGVDGLLDFVSQNRELWLTSVMVGGPVRDDEVLSIVDASREVLAEQTIAALGLAAHDTPRLRAMIRGYGGLVQEITLEWLERGRLSREEAREVLVRALPLLLEHVLPAIEPGGV